MKSDSNANSMQMDFNFWWVSQKLAESGQHMFRMSRLVKSWTPKQIDDVSHSINHVLNVFCWYVPPETMRKRFYVQIEVRQGIYVGWQYIFWTKNNLRTEKDHHFPTPKRSGFQSSISHELSSIMILQFDIFRAESCTLLWVVKIPEIQFLSNTNGNRL